MAKFSITKRTILSCPNLSVSISTFRQLRYDDYESDSVNAASLFKSVINSILWIENTVLIINI